MEKKIGRCKKVCVTGGAGFIGSWLVKKLLERGYLVHATLRNLEDTSKTGLFKSFPNASTNLFLFEADIYSPQQFSAAIEGCEIVFHIATPLQPAQGSLYKDATKAAVAGAKSIAMSCIKSGTVRRLIYTASVVAASPLKDDGSGFKDAIDEECWTPLNLPYAYSNDYLKFYTASKTLSEKEILKYGKSEDNSLEVVSLACGLVGGDTLQSYTSPSTALLLSQLMRKNANASTSELEYESLKFLEELLAKIPIIHIDDVCEAHIFCMEHSSSINGRFLCASSYVSSADIARYYQQNHPQLQIKHGQDEDCFEERNIKWKSTKLEEKGFKYKYDTEMILNDCVVCAKKMGQL